MAILNNSNAISSGGYDINNSLRFRSSNSAYLSRTPASTGNRQTFTYSFWMKRGTLGTLQRFVGVSDNATGDFIIDWTTSNTLEIYDNGPANVSLVTTQVFRDPSAWYHIVCTYDTTNATTANRVKMYVNGTQVTAFGTATYPTQNTNSFNNQASIPARIGIWPSGSQYFDGYMAEFNFIDGTALTPSSFGETDTTTGSWKPKAYTGTYGTNGFYLKFSDIATTSGSNAGLGKDFSGNGNYWNTNNISVTAGSTYDAMTDVPTNTSATVANYCVLNPLNKNTNVTVSNANLTSTSAVSNAGISGTMYVKSSGKYYWEATCTTKTTYPIVGIVNEAWSSGTNALTYPGATSGSYGYANDGLKYNNGSTASYGASYTSGDIIGVALDLDAGTLTFYKNNTSQGTAYTGLTDSYAPSVSGQASDVWNVNFGQRPFAYTPPSGFVALNTFNLPDSTIKAGNNSFGVLTYTGNGSTSVTRSDTSLVNFTPDFVWIKERSGTAYHNLFDINRVVSGDYKRIYSNDTTAEESSTYFGTTNLNGFVNGGFTTGSGGNTNNNGSTYVAWCWDANGSPVSNTSGSITSTVSVNTTAGFSIVTYTGTGSNATVGHGLGVAPAMIITKYRGTESWAVYHTSTGNTKYLVLNATSAAATASTVWQNTSPTSTVFSVGTAGLVNTSGGSGMLAYCWAEIAGFSKFTSYTGNGSNDGVFVYCGFRPKFIMMKSSSSVSSWAIVDTSRDTYNLAGQGLDANTSAAEFTPASSGYPLDILSNGFKLRYSGQPNTAQTYIFMAFAENPFKNALAR